MPSDTDRALAQLTLILPGFVDMVDNIEMRAEDATMMRTAAEAVSIDVNQRRPVTPAITSLSLTVPLTRLNTAQNCCENQIKQVKGRAIPHRRGVRRVATAHIHKCSRRVAYAYVAFNL